MESSKGPIISQLDMEEGFSPLQRYSATKLSQLLFGAKLAELISAEDVTINLVNPSLVSGTEMHTGNSDLWRVTTLKAILGRRLADGASAYVDAVVVKGKASRGSCCSDWTTKP